MIKEADGFIVNGGTGHTPTPTDGLLIGNGDVGVMSSIYYEQFIPYKGTTTDDSTYLPPTITAYPVASDKNEAMYTLLLDILDGKHGDITDELKHAIIDVLRKHR